ncbi:MAG: NAD(P)-binding domain-containing protein, partial [Candidatus Nanopelagicales bacterium]
MKIGVLGTGIVGRSLASGWLSAGHQVALGSRTSDNEAAVGWVASSGGHASHGSFVDAVAHGEVIVNCTPGDVSLAILADVGSEAIGDSVLLDVANPLDFSGGFP